MRRNPHFFYRRSEKKRFQQLLFALIKVKKD
ncbi:hypothetical protein HMPREF9431_00148 [Segatella oulorum F0390]|uniref:Uncharacterized protein n=1 Tax=Segatella oulorum F0390 TaxID=702438 RepID=G1W8J7_9BACT|nr:hypothetical protein HMPREF9431_00148 [Segatella oulorum F0390]